jgi:hypothetical protein
MAGLGGLGAIRLPPSPIDGSFDDDDDMSSLFTPRDVDLSDDDGGIDYDKATKIETDDGGVIVYIGPPRIAKEDTEFDDNLAEVLPDTQLNGLADELIRLIDQDNESRREWLDTRARGMELMGLRIESMRSSGSEGSAPLEGQSQIRATLLAEAVIRFGANAFAELCPTDGPAKVSEDTAGATPALDDLADALEHDLNHYLTVVDKPWIPDTDQMLLRVGLDGCVFKKVCHDPILRRPISRAVFGDDLIVNNSATSIYDAGRITHRVFMRPSMVKRMQICGAWRDVDLSTPGYIEKSATELQSEQISGVRKYDSWEQDDREHEFLETYCELDLDGFEHETDGSPDGLAVPYKAVIHRETRTIVELRRNYNEDDEMCLPKTYFVQFPFIRGFGFYAIGLSHLLGNITNGITAAWREIVDAGMFANFPGLLVAKGAARQNNNIFRIPPGGSAEVETGGLPIQQVAMGMPYRSPDAVWVGFVQQLNEQGKSLGGTAEVMVGEGRQDAPVGTTLALIEQAIKPLLATHKRLCAAQSDELQLLVDRFREDPESFLRTVRRQKKKASSGPQMPANLSWDEQLFLQAINENSIVTKADPNTASHLQRMLRNAALYQMAKDEPGAFNVLVIRRTCIRGIGFANPDQYLNPVPQGPPPDPKAQAAMLTGQASMLDAQTKAGQLELDKQNVPMDNQQHMVDAQVKIATSKMGLQKQQLATQTAHAQASNEARKPLMERQKQQFEGQQNQFDRAHDTATQLRDQAHEMNLERGGWAHEQQLHAVDRQHEAQMGQQEQMHDRVMGAQKAQTDMVMGAQDRQHEQVMGAREQQMESQREERGRQHESMMTDRTQAHERSMGQQEQAHEDQVTQREERHEAQMGQEEHRARLQEVKAKPRPASSSSRTQRAAGGSVQHHIDTPYGLARRAPDGEFYVQHPRTGQYFRIRRK